MPSNREADDLATLSVRLGVLVAPSLLSNSVGVLRTRFAGSHLSRYLCADNIQVVKIQVLPMTTMYVICNYDRL